MDQIHPFSLTARFANKTRVSPVLQPGPSTLEKLLQLGPVFFSLARKLKILYRLVLKIVLAITSLF
jgi:hypothetical protein